MCALVEFACLVALVLLAVLLVAAPRSGNKEGYLVYPYLDLDEPGERGDYYGLQSC